MKAMARNAMARNAIAQTHQSSNPHRLNLHHLIPHNFEHFTLHALLDEARLLMGQERALQYRLAAVLRELDSRAHHGGKPMRLPQWLHDNFGLTFGAAREKVRTARALGSLPLIDAAFRDGELSYSKVRALTRAATSENEEQLLTLCRGSDAEGVERVVRQVKTQACLDDVQALIRSRSLSTRWDETGALLVQGRLTPEQGEVFLKALAKATEVLKKSCDTERDSLDTNANANADTETDTYWAYRADALVQVMADSLIGGNPSAPGDRHQVHVHVSAETLAGENTETEIDKTHVPAETLHPETIRRLACDGGLVTIIENAKGGPLSVGRKTRAIPPSTRPALLSRDRHCQFPGCTQDRYVEGHHVVHWAKGGETRLDNLVLLCSRHHQAVHEFGYRIERTGTNGIKSRVGGASQLSQYLFAVRAQCRRGSRDAPGARW